MEAERLERVEVVKALEHRLRLAQHAEAHRKQNAAPRSAPKRGGLDVQTQTAGWAERRASEGRKEARRRANLRGMRLQARARRLCSTRSLDRLSKAKRAWEQEHLTRGMERKHEQRLWSEPVRCDGALRGRVEVVVSLGRGDSPTQVSKVLQAKEAQIAGAAGPLVVQTVFTGKHEASDTCAADMLAAEGNGAVRDTPHGAG
jgi:hypothetical protein